MDERPAPSEPHLPRRRWVILAVMAIALVAAGLAWRGSRRRVPSAPLRVMLLPAHLEKGCALQADEALALDDLLRDALELGGGRAVSRVTELPPPADWARSPKEGLVIQLLPQRVGQRLRLDARYISAADLRRNGTWIRHDARPLLPADAVADLLRHLPGPRMRTDLPLLPAHPGSFWAYVDTYARMRREGPTDAGLAAAEKLAEQEANSAAIHRAVGFWFITRASRSDALGPEAVNTALAHCLRALELCPGYPAAVADFTRLKVESGAPREALATLQAALRQRPHSPQLLLYLAYAARFSGLDPLDRMAFDELDHVYLHPTRPFPFQAAFIHSDHRDRFLASLWVPPASTNWTLLAFYQGYIHLLEGRRPEALAAFRQVATGQRTQRMFETSELFQAILEDRRPEAQAILARLELRQIRTSLPDGELAFLLAEAAGLMGDAEKAVDLSQRAFAQGFGNLTWYQASPLLEAMRAQPRWPALERNMWERQRSLAATFPLESWGL